MVSHQAPLFLCLLDLNIYTLSQILSLLYNFIKLFEISCILKIILNAYTSNFLKILLEIILNAIYNYNEL